MNWYQYLQNITTVRTDLSSAGDGFCPQSKTHRACKDNRSFLPFRLNITLSCRFCLLQALLAAAVLKMNPHSSFRKSSFREASKTGLERRRKSSLDYHGNQKLFSRVQRVRRVRSDASESAAAEMKSWGLWHPR